MWIRFNPYSKLLRQLILITLLHPCLVGFARNLPSKSTSDVSLPSFVIIAQKPLKVQKYGADEDMSCLLMRSCYTLLFAKPLVFISLFLFINVISVGTRIFFHLLGKTTIINVTKRCSSQPRSLFSSIQIFCSHYYIS